MDLSTLEARYLGSCKKHEVLPNSAVLSWFSQAKLKKCDQEKRSITVLLDQLKDADISPLEDLILALDYTDIDAIDVLHEAQSNLNAKSIMSLLHAVNQKLRVVDLHNIPLEEDFLRNLCNHGLSCQILNMRTTHIKKLNMDGSFVKLHTLNLDFCTSITSFHKDCFSGMPNLKHLSMCETRVANLWTTAAALSKLPSLQELRFQNCLCCKHTGPCPASIGTSTISEVFGVANDLSEFNEVDLSSCLQRIPLLKISSDVNKQAKWQTDIAGKEDASTLKNYISNHPSPICFEKHYREYMVTSLPHLEVLDNLSLTQREREVAMSTLSNYYEYFPYNRRNKESIVNILWKRELGTSGVYQPTLLKPKQPYNYGKSRSFIEKSLSAAKFGSTAWPLFHPLNSFKVANGGGSKKLRARQFEYHPSDSCLMVLGTLDGEVVVLNHENGNIVGYVPSIGAMDSVIGLCWLKKYPSKLLAGSDNGCLKLLDINHMRPKVADVSCRTGVVIFEEFQQLTSVHVNSTDDQFLASGYSRDLALYDINSGVRVQLFMDMHREPINVAKFAHHSPFLFATSSFDHDVKLWDLRQKPRQPCYTASSSRGNVMVCFSPDDRYLLVSAVDNEVKQLLAADGRLSVNFQIAPTGSAHNYTRSYYMNGGDYIISGSCDEHVVRICCSQTGRRLKDVCMEDIESGNPLFVQSLRSDPSRLFHMSVLTASKRLSSKWELIKVNLLASSSYGKECYYGQLLSSFCGLGG